MVDVLLRPLFLDQLVEKGIVFNYENANKLGYKVVKDRNPVRRIQSFHMEGKAIVSVTLDSPFSLSKSQGDTVTKLEGFIEKKMQTRSWHINFSLAELKN